MYYVVVSEQRFHEVRVRFQYERQRHGFYRAAVVFSWRRSRRVVRFAAEEAVSAVARRAIARRSGVGASQRRQEAASSLVEFEQTVSLWGCSVAV